MMETDKFVAGPINLGNPNEFTMLELAQKIIKLTNSRSKISYQPLPQDDPRQRQPNITKAKNILGWQPLTELNEGLYKTVEYFEGVLND
jgi:UDP-glucuronate decarboxylase